MAYLRTDREILLEILEELRKLNAKSQPQMPAPEGMMWVQILNPTHDMACTCNSCKPHLIGIDSPQGKALRSL